MAKPTPTGTDLRFATNPNYAGGSDITTPTKSEFIPGRKADGWRKGNKPPAQEFNWWMHWIADWVRFTYDEVLSVFVTDAGVLKPDTVDTSQIVDDSILRSHIEEGANLVINSTARRGNAFWWGDGGGAASPDPDPEYANAPVWEEFAHWTANTGRGPEWVITSPTSLTQGDLSEKIMLLDSTPLVLSCEMIMVGRTNGQLNIDILCYDNGGNLLSTIAAISITADTSGYETFEATGTTPVANTDYIRIRKWVNNLTATVVAVRRVKTEFGTIATVYSDESSMPQYLSARRTSDNGTQVLTSGASLNVIFENPTSDSDVFDDPGTDRYNTGTGYFTADRYMKLEISAKLMLLSSSWFAKKQFEGTLFLTPLGGGEVLYARLWHTLVETAITSGEISGNGNTMIELNKGDKFRLKAFQDSGSNKTILGDSLDSYLDIREI